MAKKKPIQPTKSKPDPDSDTWGFAIGRGTKFTFLCISLFAVVVRLSVGIHPYSGAGTPPKFGDYEAQRHWMEITTNLPLKEWYRNSSTNDLNYWGLDYPPLTAYQSYIHGLLLKFFDPVSVSLFSSRGYESYFGKLLMRWTVLSSDLLIFFPAVLYFVTVYYSQKSTGAKSSSAWHIAMILFSPCLILIDHGHFQYNCISLGLTIAAVAAIFSDRDLVGCVLFSLALNHKQMSAYYAPAFFGHLLGKCIRSQNPVFVIAKLALVVLGTFAVVWSPYLHSIDSCFEVLSRLAPFERGIYEDYVANFWCTTSVLVKWKILFTTQSLKLISLAATTSTFLAPMIMLILLPTKQSFLYGLLNCSLAFYLFSFQVHEKSILLPLLPASLLAVEEPFIFRWLVHYAMLSMFPLLRRDNLILPYIALYGLFVLLYNAPGRRTDTGDTSFLGSTFQSLLLASSFVLHIIYMTATPPDKYPFLFEAIIMLLSFSQFVFIYLYSNSKHWALRDRVPHVDVQKKSL